MSQPAIAVCDVSKRFRRGGHAELTRDLLARALRRARRTPRADEFWGLRHVSFEVAAGEAFGVIGPNGAGKSTLLKLLAGILRADAGTIELRGTLSALIELGAGFHGDLTGRENIFLNASILGMARRDVRARFDEIVDFAGIGESLDTPVKWYSSGMYARLGFAVAAHVNPRVLLIDEVLSVGDRAFRAKCMAKMGEFLRDGVAIVFVSHDVSSVQRFCHRAMVLRNGESSFLGSAAEAVLHYQDACLEPHMMTVRDSAAPVRIRHLQLCDPSNHPATRIKPGAAVRVRFDAEFDIDMPHPSYGLSLIRLDDHMTLFESSSSRLGFDSPPAGRGDRQRICYDVKLNVPPGQYAIGIHVRDRDGVAYAMQDIYAMRLHVDGLPTASGMVHLAPRVHVESADAADERPTTQPVPPPRAPALV